MKIQISTFLAAVQKLMPALSKQSMRPIYDHIRCKYSNGILTLDTSDTVVQIQCKIPATHDNDVMFTMPAKKLLNILQSVKSRDFVEIDITRDKCIITNGRSTFVVRPLEPDDFDDITQANDDKFKCYAMSHELLRNMLSHAALSVATNDNRVYFNSILLEVSGDELLICGTNGHRLSAAIVPLQSPKQVRVLIPPSAFHSIKPLLTTDDAITNIKIFDGTLEVVIDDNTTVFTALGDCDAYPDIKDMVNFDAIVSIKVNKQALKTALNGATLIHEAVTLAFSKNTLLVSTKEAAPIRKQGAFMGGSADAGITIDYDGQDFDVCFLNKYLLAGVMACNEDMVTLEFSNLEKGDMINMAIHDQDVYLIAQRRGL
ncbi:MAG: DNA polymerase III subunit beta [Thiomargarita sp.]|nr:DNA polymerase III subunit beta [Thiomargarita sp.]